MWTSMSFFVSRSVERFGLYRPSEFATPHCSARTPRLEASHSIITFFWMLLQHQRRLFYVYITLRYEHTLRSAFYEVYMSSIHLSDSRKCAILPVKPFPERTLQKKRFKLMSGNFVVNVISLTNLFNLGSYLYIPLSHRSIVNAFISLNFIFHTTPALPLNLQPFQFQISNLYFVGSDYSPTLTPKLHLPPRHTSLIPQHR